MSPRRVKPRLGQMVVRGGWRSARLALRYASRYGLACEALGHPPTIKEYQGFHGVSQAQAYKEWKAWKVCVGEVSVLEAVSDEALSLRGLSEADREDALARWFAS